MGVIGVHGTVAIAVGPEVIARGVVVGDDNVHVAGRGARDVIGLPGPKPGQVDGRAGSVKRVQGCRQRVDVCKRIACAVDAGPGPVGDLRVVIHDVVTGKASAPHAIGVGRHVGRGLHRLFARQDTADVFEAVVVVGSRYGVAEDMSLGGANEGHAPLALGGHDVPVHAAGVIREQKDVGLDRGAEEKRRVGETQLAGVAQQRKLQRQRQAQCEHRLPCPRRPALRGGLAAFSGPVRTRANRDTRMLLI